MLWFDQMGKIKHNLFEEVDVDMVMVSIVEEAPEASKSIPQKLKELQKSLEMTIMEVKNLAKEFRDFKTKHQEKNTSHWSFIETKLDSFFSTPKDLDTKTLDVEEIFFLM